MNDLRYLDFDLQIETTPVGYRAQVLNSPAGPAQMDFVLPFSDLELENALLRLGGVRRTMRSVDAPEIEAARTFGGKLFEAVFDGEVRGCLRSSLDEAEQQGVGLRLRLRLTNANGISDLPWEYLYNPAQQRFLALSTKTPLVRYLDLPEPIRSLDVMPPLHVLALVASPTDYPPLDVAAEWQHVQTALGDFVQRGLITLERLEEATLEALQNRLREGVYHIFHFIGHGTFNEQAQDGELILEDAQGRGRRVRGQFLGTLLHDHDPLRLAILNACEGGRGSATNPMAGTAQSLVQQGIPAVIAMQFEVSDEAAINFARAFYGALADRYPVDGALSEARKAIFVSGNGVEWGTPVLYMRAPDGCIFDLADPVAARPAAGVQVAGASLMSPARGVPVPAPIVQPGLTPIPAVPPMEPTVASVLARIGRVRITAIAGVLALLLVAVGVWALWPAPAPPPFERRLFVKTPPLTGADVIRVQTQLITLGYLPPGAADGVFGPQTERAIQIFQREHDLEVDGIVGPLTWSRLFSADPRRGPDAVARLSAPPTNTAVPPSAEHCEVIAPELNLRTGPDKGYESLLRLPRGTILRAQERNAANTWISVDVPGLGAAGWVSTNPTFISCAAIVPTLPIAVLPPTPTAPAQTPTAIPCLNDALSGAFKEVFDADADTRVKLGCAIAALDSGAAVNQLYAGGTLFWWSKTNTIFALLGGTNGHYRVFTAEQTAALPAAPTPVADTSPVRGFGRIYFGVPEIRAALGVSLSVEHAINGKMQQFQKGRMILSTGQDGLADTVFVLYNNGAFESFAASATP